MWDLEVTKNQYAERELCEMMLPHGARQGFIIGACLFDLKMDIAN